MKTTNIVTDQIQQSPSPGKRFLRFRGDTYTFTLTLSAPRRGTAWLRTNIGHAATTKSEIINAVRQGIPRLGRDWFDLPMRQTDDRSYRLTLPLTEVGHFEAKGYFLEENDPAPKWPAGSNTIINVEPADTCCANSIYNTFVRQFGPNKSRRQELGTPAREMIAGLDRNGYTVIPPSGTFRNLIAELDFIITELGCRFIQLLPIHPTPTTYARMGRFGSPYAALNFTDVDPALAEFDPKATPLEQFIELVDAIHARNAKIILDIAINHTGWAATLHESHPEWLMRKQDGHIEVPGAWGVVWADLTSLDYSHQDLWQYMADIFLLWCRRGVDGFRCDAGYMIPVEAWKYIVSTVREQFPSTIFLLEGLGGKVSVTRDILNTANFNWAYSELFQNYDRSQIESYLPGALAVSETEGIMVHFAETHDNNRLAATSTTWAKMRTALCALCAPVGAFGFAGGVEWHAAEKINVHDACPLNWGSKTNQVAEIRRLQTLLKTHPAFHDRVELKMVHVADANQILLRRRHPQSGKQLFILANLDAEAPSQGSWSTEEAASSHREYTDLLTGKRVKLESKDGRCSLSLAPGEVLCLTPDGQELEILEKSLKNRSGAIPERILLQRRKAKALDVYSIFNGLQDISDFDTADAACRLAENPLEFCRHLNHTSSESRVVAWQWPRDANRVVMIPPGHFLLVTSPYPFRANIRHGNVNLCTEESMPRLDGSHFALFSPLPARASHQRLQLFLSLFTNGTATHHSAVVLFLQRGKNVVVKNCYKRKELLGNPLLYMAANGSGAMLRARLAWGELQSRYDALLAANLNPEFPEDRWIMLTRCRAWLNFQGYSQDIGQNCLHSFRFDRSGGSWHFRIPAGQGEYVSLTITAAIVPRQNIVQLQFFRHPNEKSRGVLSDNNPVALILRPDIEDRSFHAATKAYAGPENEWPGLFSAARNQVDFTPAKERHLTLSLQPGEFTWEPEWQYMVKRPFDGERGFDPDSDLFSPGYFTVQLRGGDRAMLTAAVHSADEKSAAPPSASSLPEHFNPADRSVEPEFGAALREALDHYVVHRSGLKSVIAGYPWFLDWGRDSLIVCRGMIAAGMLQEARAVLIQFGRFEKEGTLPNMIHGWDARNRDTSDAPLWFFVACNDLIQKEDSEKLLDESCGGRSVREVLLSLGNHFLQGTPNGICPDKQSGLIFSPAHFTWMDTNHPAGTPRQGYPIEIQALWHYALEMLARIDLPERSKNWRNAAEQVRKSISRYFLLEKEGYLSDCLHADPGVPASKAVADNALRPNQLLAVTLGAVVDPDLCRSVVEHCRELLVPGAIRSLANRPLSPPLAIHHQGKLLNDPHNPYWGHYSGDEDTRRKPAYHNGTAWTWIFPSFSEAWRIAFGKASTETARSWLTSSTEIINGDAVGHVPEILDGDAPHHQRGCDAQAWGVSELLRVWLLLK